MRSVAKDTAQTAARGVMLIFAALLGLITGPHLELWLAPPVALWEIHNPRVEGGELRWSVVVAQVRDCRAQVAWSLGGEPLTVSGPPFDFKRGDAAEIGTYRAPVRARAGAVLSATVAYNCGLPWGLAPIRKSARVEG